MNTLLIIIAGIGGTIIMTACIELISDRIKQPYHVIQTLGQMLDFKFTTPQSTFRSYLSTAFLYYSMGVGVAYLYYLLISFGVIDLSIKSALAYGVLIGALAVLCWRFFFMLHPDTPHYSLEIYYAEIWIGHIVLALIIFQVFFLVEVVQQMLHYPDVRWIHSYGR